MAVRWMLVALVTLAPFGLCLQATGQSFAWDLTLLDTGPPVINKTRVKNEVGWEKEWPGETTRRTSPSLGAVRWERHDGAARYVRTDHFSTSGEFCFGEQQLFFDGVLQSSADIRNSADGRRQWRAIKVFDASGPAPDSPDRKQPIRHYELELRKEGEIVARYEAPQPFELCEATTEYFPYNYQSYVAAKDVGFDDMLESIPVAARRVTGDGPTVEELIALTPAQALAHNRLRESPVLRRFLNHFDVQRETTYAEQGGMIIVFVPKKKLPLPCRVQTHFWLAAEKDAEITLTPELLLEHLEEICSAPEVQKLAGQDGHVQMVARWDHPRLSGDGVTALRNQLAQRDKDVSPLERWIRFSIGGPRRLSIVLLHPLGTDEYLSDR